MKTSKTKLVSTLVMWEQMHDALRAITRTQSYVPEFDYSIGRQISVKHVNYDVECKIDIYGNPCKEYTYKEILSVEIPTKIPLDSNEVQRYIDVAYNFILECKELEKPKYPDFFEGLKEIEKLPTEDEFDAPPTNLIDELPH